MCSSLCDYEKYLCEKWFGKVGRQSYWHIVYI